MTKQEREDRRLRSIYGPIVVCEEEAMPHHLRPLNSWVRPCKNPIEVDKQEK